MKVHLGCGKWYLDGYANCDLYAKRVDLRQDIREVLFDAGAVEEVLCVHTLEHFTERDGIAICRNVHSWLAAGGVFIVEMPEFYRCLGLAQGRKHDTILAGLKGFLGGRASDKDGWHAWIVKNHERIVKRMEIGEVCENIIPECWNEPGAAHLCVWKQYDFIGMLRDIGFSDVRHETPQWHGGRDSRDMRIVATK